MNTMRKFVNGVLVITSVFSVALFVAPGIALGHCDTLDGPVVTEAASALKKGEVTPVLKWVKQKHEGEIRSVFKQVLAVRSKGPEVQEIADRYFFETLIRLHRAGEGAPFTGLKPRGTIEPSVEAADKAIETGSVDALAKSIGQATEEAIREYFGRLMEAKTHKDESIEAGRKYVEAYVVYVHFVEGLYNKITRVGAHEAHEIGKDESHGHQE